MNKYTLQKDVDELGLGERWACRFLNFINAGEHSRGTGKANRYEINQILAEAFRGRLADMCNYIDHDDREKLAKDCTTWDEQDNPEWHYWVREQTRLLNVVSGALYITVNPRWYQTGIMLTQYNTHHYVLKLISGRIINPDPSLKGEIIETRPLIY